MNPLARWLEDFFFDLSFALRQLLRNPPVSAVCVLTLALGIGANAAIFSAVDTVLLRSLPFKDSDHLVLVNEYNPGNVARTGDRKSTRLNSSHRCISYAVFCLK